MAEDTSTSTPDAQASLPTDAEPHDLSVVAQDADGRYVVQHRDSGRQLTLPRSYIEQNLPELKSHLESFEAGKESSAPPAKDYSSFGIPAGTDLTKFGTSEQQLAGMSPNARLETLQHIGESFKQAAGMANAAQAVKGAFSGPKVVSDPNLRAQMQAAGMDVQAPAPVQAPPQTSPQPQAGALPPGYSTTPTQGAAHPQTNVGPSAPTGPSPEGLLVKGLNQKDEADRMAYENAVLQGQKTRPITDYNAQELQGLYAAQKEAQADLQKRQDDEMARLGDIRDQMLQASKVDPQRFWKDKTTLGKIGFGLATALSGIGGGLSGNPQAGSQLVQRAIQNDVEAQSKTVANLSDTAKVQGNVIQELRNKGLSLTQANEAAVAMLKNVTAAKLEQVANQMTDPVAKQKLVASLAGTKIEASSALAKLATERATQNHMNSAAALNYAKLRAIGVQKPNIGLAAIDDLERKLGQENLLDAAGYASERRFAAMTVAQQMSGGKAPRPALVQQIEEAFPDWKNLAGMPAGKKLQAAREAIVRMSGNIAPQQGAEPEAEAE